MSPKDSQWQQGMGVLDERLYKRRADHLRPGEAVRLIAINRATGYMGSLHTTLQSAADGDNFEISFALEALQLTPPNLKIWAERTTEVEYGLTKGDENEYRIGSEGAGLSDDKFVKIYTEWLDADGTPLPEGLEGYGFTGRLAQLVSGNQLEEVATGGNLSQFAIKPGFNLEVLKLPADEVGEQHLYIHVSAEPSERNPDFGANEVHAGILKYRPDRFVPVRVPLYDEAQTDLALQAWRSAIEANTDPNIEYIEPEPQYQWVYRPEFQFTLYDLDMQEVLVTSLDDEKRNILEDENPIITDTDQQLDLIYGLTGPMLGDESLDQLSAYSFDSERELFFQLGGNEIQATANGDGVEFDKEDIDSLSLMTDDDFLTLTLYANNDAANLLWEWAFDFLTIFTPEDYEGKGEYHFLSADDPVLALDSILVGFVDRDEEYKTMQFVKWSVDGDGDIEQAVTKDAVNGVFHNRLFMPHTAGATARVTASLQTTPPVNATYKEVVVLPGEPANINISLTGKASVRGVGDLVATAYVTDAWGNPVINGTTIGFSTLGDASIVAFDYFTKDGYATATIKGGLYAGTDNTLSVEIGTIEKQEAFGISPLSVAFTSVPTSTDINTNQTVTVHVTDSEGQPAEGVFVDIGSSHGKLAYNELVTDSNGDLVFGFHSGSAAGTAELSAQVDPYTVVKRSVDITQPAPTSPTYIDTQRAMVVSGTATGETVYQTLYDGTAQSYTYVETAQLTVKGPPSQNVEVDLGSMINPNRQPILAMPLNRFGLYDSLDSTAQSTPARTNVGLANQHKLNIGRSAAFNGTTSKIEVKDQSHLKPGNIGVKFDFKPSADGGTLLEHGGAFTMEYDLGKIRLRINTSDGQQTAETQALALDTWHTVAARISGNDVTLYADGTETPLTLTSAMTYDATLTSSDPVSTIGSNYQGYLSEFALYDLESSPLLSFDDESQQKNITFDTNGEATVTVKTSAQQASGTVLTMPHSRVGIKVDNSEGHIDVISEQRYAQSLAALSEIAQPTDPVPTFSDFKTLYADSVLYNDQTLVSAKVLYKASDFSQHAPMDLTIASLSAMKHLPQAQAIKDHLATLQTYYQDQGNPSMLYAAADVIGVAVKKAINHDEEAMERLSVALLVLAEMIEQNPTPAQYIGQSVKSKYDFENWVNFLTLPKDGWIGATPMVPAIEAQCEFDNIWINEGTALQVPLIPCRMEGREAGIMVANLADTMDMATTPQELSVFVARLYDGLSTASISTRKLILSSMNPSAIASNSNFFLKDAYAALPLATKVLDLLKDAGKHGLKNFKRFLTNNTNARENSAVILAVMAYLYDRIDDDACKGATAVDKCKKLVAENIKKRYFSLSLKALSNIIITGKFRDMGLNLENELTCKLKDDTHGAIFELMMIAYYHAKHEGTLGASDPKSEVVAVDLHNNIKLINPDNTIYTSFHRYTDIVLRGNNTAEDDDQNTFVELKSIQAWPITDQKRGVLGKFPPWSWKTKGGTTYHRQFILDRVAMRQIRVTDEEGQSSEQQFSKEMRWVFHTWSEPSKNKGKVLRSKDRGVPLDRALCSGGKGAMVKCIEKVENRLVESPKGASKEAKERTEANIGKNGTIIQQSYRNKIEMFDFTKRAIAEGFSAEMPEEFEEIRKTVDSALEEIDDLEAQAEKLQKQLDQWGDAILPDWVEEHTREYVERIKKKIEELKQKALKEIEEATDKIPDLTRGLVCD